MAIVGVYGVGGGLLAAIKAFYKESEACVRVEGGGVSEWFSVKIFIFEKQKKLIV